MNLRPLGYEPPTLPPKGVPGGCAWTPSAQVRIVLSPRGFRVCPPASRHCLRSFCGQAILNHEPGADPVITLVPGGEFLAQLALMGGVQGTTVRDSIPAKSSGLRVTTGR